MYSDSSSEIEDTDIALATTSLLTTDVLTSTSRTETTDVDPDHDVASNSTVTLTGVVVDLAALGLGPLVDQIITATITTPHVIVVVDTGLIDVLVHIGPVLSTVETANLSEADAVAVRIEVISTTPLSAAHVVIDLGSAHSLAAVAQRARCAFLAR
jgi:hypothetical protein